MSGGSAANNSWTILTSEESVGDAMRPLAEGTEHGGKSPTSAAVSAENQPASGAAAVKGDMEPENKRAELNADTSTDAAVPSSSHASSGFPVDGAALSQSEGLPETPSQSSADLDSFSDSFANITPSSSSAEPAASVLNAETLGRVDLTQEEEERLSHRGVQRPSAEGPQEEGLQPDPDQFQAPAGGENQADSTEASEVGEQEAAGEVGPQLRRRRRSLLAALERVGRAEEEEEKEEEFQLPRQQEDSGFSVNKCIVAALILLGLGTIFFSGLFMELDEESGYVPVEPGDADLPEKQEWLNAEVPQSDAENTELLNQLAQGNQQISELQLQLQAQTEELKVAQGLAEEGAKEQLQWREVEKENSRLKTKMASLPVLQKENQRMKRELDSLPALQKELETLRATVTELKLSTATNELPVKDPPAPSTGQMEDGTQAAADFPSEDKSPGDGQRIRYKDEETKNRRKGLDEEKAREKSHWKEGGRKKNDYKGKAEWQKEPEQEQFSKEKYKKGKKVYGEETEHARRGDEGKPWKDRKGDERWEERTEREERDGEKDWRKAKHQGKGLKGQREDGRGTDEDRHRGSEERKKEKEGYRESSREKHGKNHRKDREGKKEWKTEGEWKTGKEHGKEGKWRSDIQKSRDPRKDGKEWDESKRQTDGEWKSRKEDKDRKKKDERKQRSDATSGEGTHAKERKKDDKNHRERGRPKEGTKDGDGSRFHGDARESPGGHQAQLRGGGKPPQHRASVGQPEYWRRQRSRLQRNPRPPRHCHSVETCAQTEGLPPVTFPEFEAVLHTYLARAKEVGVDASAREELHKLATEFFKDGLFVHDQMSFQDFVEDLGDVLEDMVEGDEDEDGEDSDLEEEMEGFQREVMRKFAAAGASGKHQRAPGDGRTEHRRGHA